MARTVIAKAETQICETNTGAGISIPLFSAIFHFDSPHACLAKAVAIGFASSFSKFSLLANSAKTLLQSGLG